MAFEPAQGERGGDGDVTSSDVIALAIIAGGTIVSVVILLVFGMRWASLFLPRSTCTTPER